jgi:SAM-dependent methyltransferase
MKRSAPAALRNRAPIFEVLRELIGPTGHVLEVGSGTGQHADFFTEHAPGWRWQPTDLDAANLASIEAYRTEAGRQNFLPALRLDARGTDWPRERYDAVFSANMIHIAPWPATLGLLTGAARVLAPSGVLVLYGPFRFSGAFTADSNAAFDARLRGEDPTWGVRDLDDLLREALSRGFAAPRVFPMPANNHVLAFTIASAQPLI